MLQKTSQRLLLISLVVLLTGTVLILAKDFFSMPAVRDFLQALGIALISAGFVTHLGRYFYREISREPIEIFELTRRKIEREYVNRKYSAKILDIAAIALTGALGDFKKTNTLLSSVLTGNMSVRLMFLSPLAKSYITQRAKEDSQPKKELERILHGSVQSSVVIYERLSKLYKEAEASGTLRPERTGGFEIRVFDKCPYFTIYRTDHRILWGIYSCNDLGLNSAVLEVQEESGLSAQLNAHFERLWADSADNSLMGFTSPNEPRINEDLVKSLLASSGSG